MSEAFCLWLRPASCLPLTPLLSLSRTAGWKVLRRLEVFAESPATFPGGAFNSRNLAVELEVPKANSFEGLLKTSTGQIEKPKMREKAKASPS